MSAQISRLVPASSADRQAARRSRRNDPQPPDEPPTEPTLDPTNPDESDEPEEIDIPCTDDADWEVFVPDEYWDAMPEPGDFWIEDPETYDECRCV